MHSKNEFVRKEISGHPKYS